MPHIIVALITVWLLSLVPSSLYAQETFYFVSGFLAAQNTEAIPPGGREDNYFQTLSKEHGSLKDDREVVPIGFSFDFYKAYGKFGSGFGVGLQSYSKGFEFRDGSSTQLDVRSLLFTFTSYYRGGWWFPYFEFGTGNHNAKVRESLETTTTSTDDAGETTETTETVTASFIDSTPHSFHYGVGVRFPIGGWGLLVGWRFIIAELKVKTAGEKVQLGGQSMLFGGYYGF